MCQLFIDADPELWKSHTRSFRMDGMVTSVRLEELFWRALETIATRDDLTVPQLLHRLYNESLDAGHDLGNFTSFLRVCCLRFLDLQMRGLIPVEQYVNLSQLPACRCILINQIPRIEHCFGHFCTLNYNISGSVAKFTPGSF